MMNELRVVVRRLSDVLIFRRACVSVTGVVSVSALNGSLKQQSHFQRMRFKDATVLCHRCWGLIGIKC